MMEAWLLPACPRPLPPFWSALRWPTPPMTDIDGKSIEAALSRFPEVIRSAGGKAAHSVIGIGSNSTNYLIETVNGGRYVLKQNRTRTNPIEIDDLHEWATGLPQGLLRSKRMFLSDERRHALLGTDATGPWELSRFISGTKYTGRIDQASRLGKALGIMHRHMLDKGGPPVPSLHYWDDYQILEFPKEFFSKTSVKLPIFSIISTLILEAIEFCKYVGNDKANMLGWTHGDFHLDNVIFDRVSNLVFIFDFDFTRIAPGGYFLDLGSALHRCLRQARRDGEDTAFQSRVANAICAGFEEETHLTANGIEALRVAMTESLRKIQACLRLSGQDPSSGWLNIAYNHAIFLGEMMILVKSGIFENDC